MSYILQVLQTSVSHTAHAVNIGRMYFTLRKYLSYVLHILLTHVLCTALPFMSHGKCDLKNQHIVMLLYIIKQNVIYFSGSFEKKEQTAAVSCNMSVCLSVCHSFRFCIVELGPPIFTPSHFECSSVRFISNIQTQLPLYPLLHDILKSTALIGGSQVSPICPSGNSNMQMEMSINHWCNDIHRAKQKYCETYQTQCQFVHYIFHTQWPGIEPGPPQWQAADYPPTPWHGPELRTSSASYTPHRKHFPSQLWTNRLMLEEQWCFNARNITNRPYRSNVGLITRTDGKCT